MVAYREWCAWIAGAALTLSATACASSNHRKAEVLGKVIEREPTTTTTAAPSTTTPPTTAATAAPTTTTTTTSAAPAARSTTTTTAAPRATATPSTTAPSTTTTASTIAGESLAPGPYVEESDGSGFVTVEDTGKIGAVSIAPEVIERPARTYRTHIDIEFEEQDASKLTLTPRIFVNLENTSGRQITLPGAFDLHLLCTRSGAPWLDLHVTDGSITELTPGATVSVSTTPVPLPGPGFYTCTATLPIVLT